LITEHSNFEKVLKKEYKEYLVTVVAIGIWQNEQEYYFYNPISINVSQKLLDKILSSNSSSKISLFTTWIFVGILLLISVIAYFCKRYISPIISPSSFFGRSEVVINTETHLPSRSIQYTKFFPVITYKGLNALLVYKDNVKQKN
jgi:hypothetical protein